MYPTESTSKIDGAIAKINGTIIKTNKENPHFRAKYADLEAVWEKIKPLLEAEGLVVFHQMRVTADSLVMDTTLRHIESGQSVSTEYPVAAEKKNPQAIGSAETYAKRRSLTMLLGLVCAEEDDDGGRGSEPVGRAQRPVAPKTSDAAPKISVDALKVEMQRLMKQWTGLSGNDYKSAWLKFKTAHQLGDSPTTSQLIKAGAWLQRQIDDKADAMAWLNAQGGAA